jgi:lipopolysaccharide biosynthesis regulator YciM
MILEQQRYGEAEGLWRAALTHDPHFLQALVGLSELYIKTGNAAGIERQLAELGAMGPAADAEAAMLSARWKASQGDYAGAVAILEEAIKRMPEAIGPRVALSHIHIAADSPPKVLEQAFRGVLELDPHNAQAKRNLEVLYRKTGRWIEGIKDNTNLSI